MQLSTFLHRFLGALKHFWLKNFLCNRRTLNFAKIKRFQPLFSGCSSGRCSWFMPVKCNVASSIILYTSYKFSTINVGVFAIDLLIKITYFKNISFQILRQSFVGSLHAYLPAYLPTCRTKIPMLVNNFYSSENTDVTLYRVGVISLLDDTLSSVDSIFFLSFSINS